MTRMRQSKGTLKRPLRRGRRLAAIMLEPLQGEGGITPATREFFRAAGVMRRKRRPGKSSLAASMPRAEEGSSWIKG